MIRRSAAARPSLALRRTKGASALCSVFRIPAAMSGAALCATVTALPARASSADDPAAESPVPSEDHADEGRAIDDEHWFEGTLVLAAAGEVAFLEQTQMRDGGPFALGVSFGGVVAPRWSPVLFGIGGGILYLNRAEWRGPTVAVLDSGDLFVTTTTVSRSAQLRHVEALLRFQPLDGTLRPFIEGAFGVMALWEELSLEDANGNVLDRTERQHDIALLYGATLGVDLRLFPVVRDETSTYGFLLTAGLRRWFTSPLRGGQYVSSDADEVLRRDVREPLRQWTPFVGLSFGVDSRAEARLPAANR